jgi:hypothetical protein
VSGCASGSSLLCAMLSGTFMSMAPTFDSKTTCGVLPSMRMLASGLEVPMSSISVSPLIVASMSIGERIETESVKSLAPFTFSSRRMRPRIVPAISSIGSPDALASASAASRRAPKSSSTAKTSGWNWIVATE